MINFANFCLEDHPHTQQMSSLIHITLCHFEILTRKGRCSGCTIVYIFLCHPLSKGFRYGSDIVPFSKVDQEQMKYKCDGKCFAVLGFTKQNLVPNLSLLGFHSLVTYLGQYANVLHCSVHFSSSTKFCFDILIIGSLVFLISFKTPQCRFSVTSSWAHRSSRCFPPKMMR